MLTGVVSAVVAVFLVVGTGVALRRLDWLTEQADQSLMALTVRVLMPCLILDTTLGNERVRELANLAWAPLVGAGTLLAGFAAAALLLRAWGPRAGLASPAERRTFVLTTGVYNYGYIPVPLARLLFDSGTLGVLFVFLVGVEVAMWTAGVLVLTGGLDRGFWRRALNPPSIAVACAVALNLLRLDGLLPESVRRAIAMLGECAIPVALLLVGATVADQLHEARWREGGAVVGAALVLRLGLLPLLFLCGAALLPVSLELKRVLVLEAAMPAAMFPVVMARYYGGDARTAVRVVLGTSFAALVTIPLWLALGLRLLPR